MNNEFLTSNDSVGTDPSIVTVIDSLDVEPSDDKKKSNKTKYKPSKDLNGNKGGKSIIKKILFTIVILILMGLVSYGVYYYLSLGRNIPEQTTAAPFEIEDKTYYLNEKYSTKITDYGSFDKVNLAECKIDFSNIDITKKGSYDYTVTCNGKSRVGKITYVEKNTFAISMLNIYKTVNSEINAKEFVSSEKDYSYEFDDKDKIEANMKVPGGPYLVKIKISDKDSSIYAYATLNVTSENPFMYLTCNSAKNTDSSLKYYLIDKIGFNKEKNNMNISTRQYVYSFDETKDYEEKVKEIDNGTISLGSQKGFALIDNVKNEIRIVENLNNETLSSEYGSEFPNVYSDINEYYRNTLKYTCSI